MLSFFFLRNLLLSKLTSPSVHHCHTYQTLSSLCQHKTTREELYIFRGHIFAHHLHNLATSAKIRAFELCRRYVLVFCSFLLSLISLTLSSALEVPDDTPEGDERCRAIERGARIVTVVPSRFAVTLQMPRGNTETIFPRALVLSGIRKHIDKLNYRAAFMACRAQMVDMNLLHDYNPTQFMAHVPLFIDQVKDAAFIDEFLSRLRYVVKSATSFFLPFVS